MRQNEANRNETDYLEIDRILATDEALVPSSGFPIAVMERVREEAAAPAPIPFPWKRALPGMLTAACLLAGTAVALARQPLPAMHEFLVSTPAVPAGVLELAKQAGWAALALGVSAASWMLSKRLAGRSELI